MTAPFFTGRIFFRRSGPDGGGFAGACRQDNSSANISPAPAHRDPLGYSGISPIGGARFIQGSNLYACRRAFVKKIVVTFGGASLIKGLISTPTRRGLTFVRAKVSKTRLGRCPKTPVAGCAGYGLIFDGSPKSIRTAHRIAPKVATGVRRAQPPLESS